jgi:FKBP-type peptidyl-prolyl cis-trans isomerase
MITPLRVAIVAVVLGVGTAVLIAWLQPEPPPETGYTEALPPPPPTTLPAFPLAQGPRTDLQGGLTFIDVKIGTGPAVKIGDHVAMNYVGRLYLGGQKFDASADHGQPLSFQAGEGQMIPGVDQGILGMKVGGKRQILVPPQMGYGDKGTPDGKIPPNSPIVFDVELVTIQH